MKSTLIAAGVASIGLATVSTATVTWDVAIGTLHTSSGAVVPEDALWAMVYQNTSGALPGGLEPNSSINSGDLDAATTAFSGRTIEVGQAISGSSILFVGTVDQVGQALYSVAGAQVPLFPGVAGGGLWGLYWFPGLTMGNKTLPAVGFEIGGFTQTDFSVEPYGNLGTVIPADGATSTTTFYDKVTTNNPDDLPVERFTAVPEASTLTLSVLGLGALLRRRRK